MSEAKKPIKPDKPNHLYVKEHGVYSTRKAYMGNKSQKSMAKWHIPVSKQVILRLIKWLEGL